MRRIHLYLITPKLSEAESFLPKLQAALAATKVACVLVRLASKDQHESKKILQALTPLVQASSTALIVEGDVQLAARNGSDGVQVSGVGEALTSAISSMKPKNIVGVGGLRSKDECMSAGELDVDYLIFGEPTADGHIPASDKTLERVAWWAEIFNVPCVAYAAQESDVAPLTAAGAEFIAPGEWMWASDDIDSHLKAVALTIRQNTPED